MDKHRYGTVDGKDVYSRDEYIFAARGFGAIENSPKGDTFLLKYAKEVTSNWYESGWHRTFETYYLGNYCLDEPMASLTTIEYARLKELQREARKKAAREEAAKEWKYEHTVYYADNSEEEVWVNKYGERKTVMTVAPHGDVC